MPITITDIPGLGTRQFPDNMSQEDIKAAIANEQSFGASEEPSALQKLGVGFGAGLTNFGQGIKQLGLEGAEALGIVPRGTSSDYTQQATAQQKEYEQTPIGSSGLGAVGKFLGQGAPFAALPYGAITGALGRLGGSAAIGALAGGSSFVPEDSNRAYATAAGGLLGPVAEYGAPLLITPVTKGINAVTGRGIPEEAATLMGQSQQLDVPLYAQNVSSSPTVQRSAQLLSKVPLGMTGALEAQQTAGRQAAQDYVLRAQQQMLDANPGVNGLRKIEAAALDPNNKRYGAANQILRSLNDESDPGFTHLIQSSGNTQLLRKKMIADNYFNRVENLSGNNIVDLNNAKAAFQGTLDELSALPIANEGLKSDLAKVGDALVKPLNFKGVRDLRSQLNNMISDYYSGNNAVIGKQGVGYLQKVSNALGQDVDSYMANANPQLKSAFDKANSFYQKNVIPYKYTALAKALKNQNPDQIYQSFIQNGLRDGKANILYGALDPKGQAAVRYGIISDAMANATDAQGNISLAKFVSALENRSGATGVFFKGSDAKQLEGVKNVLAHISGGRGLISMPETGVQNLPTILKILFGAGVATHPVATGAGAIGAFGLQKLMTNPKGIRFLLASSTLKPGSPQMQKLIDASTSILKPIFISTTAKSGAER